MQIPPFLHPGDVVSLVSPAGCIDQDCLDRGLKILNVWKLQVRVGEHVLDRYHLFAGREEDRLADIQHALNDSQTKAIFFTRGGYGTAALIDKLDFTAFEAHPKWLIGFSDITVMHSHLQQHLQIASLHATMPQTYPIVQSECGLGSPIALDTLHKALFGIPLSYHLLPSHARNHSGKATGQIIGGNLSVLYSLRGTPTDIDTEGKILFIEDLNELDYHVDRMLQNLYRGGWFDRISALIVGAFTGIKPGARSLEEDVWQTVDRYVAASYQRRDPYPVYYGFPSGHIIQQHALYMGIEAELIVKPAGMGNSSLSFLL